MIRKYFLLFFLLTKITFAQTGFFKTFTSTNLLLLKDMDTTHDGGYVMCGQDYYLNGGNFIVIKTDSLGDEEWRFKNNDYANPSTTFNRNYAEQIRETSNHCFIILGTIWVTSSNVRVLVAKLDSSGGLIWKKQYSITSRNFASALFIASDSSIYIAGRENDNNGNFILKLNFMGDSIWSKVIPNNNAPFNPVKIVKQNSNFFIVGSKDSTIIQPLHSFSTIELFCTDLFGNLQWKKAYFDTLDILAVSDLKVSQSGELVIASSNGESPSTQNYSITIFSTDTLGNLINSHLFYVINEDYSAGIFINDSTVINYRISVANYLDTFSIGTYNFNSEQNNRIQNYHLEKTAITKTIINRNKEVLFLGVYSDVGPTRYSILSKTNQTFIGIKDFISQNTFSVYPNPADAFIIFSIQGKTLEKYQSIEIQLVNCYGVPVLQQSFLIGKAYRMGTQGLLPGLYIYKISSNQNVIKSGKIIINH